MAAHFHSSFFDRDPYAHHPPHWPQSEPMPRSSAYSSYFDYPDLQQSHTSAWLADAANQTCTVGSSAPIYADYSESPQPPLLTTSSQRAFPSPPPSVPVEGHVPRSMSRLSGFNDSQWAAGAPYVFQSNPPSPGQRSSPPNLPVKMEQDDNAGCFIMELSPPQVETSLLSQSLAPPTEVPLRATQASKKMRGMMTVFRLNPFAMHSGEGRGLVSSMREEARPLEEKPLIFEFQLDIDGLHSDEPLHSFSPDFELHDIPDEGPGDPNEWGDSGRSGSAYCTTPLSWELEYPSSSSSEEHYPRLDNATLNLHHPRHTSRLHNSVSHPYLRKNANRDVEPSSAHMNDHGCSSNSNSASAGATNVSERLGQLTEVSVWGRGGYAPTLRNSPHDSPGCDPSVPIASVNRRWSLPETNPNTHVPFFA